MPLLSEIIRERLEPATTLLLHQPRASLSLCLLVCFVTPMLSRTLNVATRRGFATAVSDAASGVKVASVDFGHPTSAVTVLVKAGPRFQSKDGLSNVLKNFAFKVCVCDFFWLFFFVDDWFLWWF